MVKKLQTVINYSLFRVHNFISQILSSWFSDSNFCHTFGNIPQRVIIAINKVLPKAAIWAKNLIAWTGNVKHQQEYKTMVLKIRRNRPVLLVRPGFESQSGLEIFKTCLRLWTRLNHGRTGPNPLVHHSTDSFPNQNPYGNISIRTGIFSMKASSWGLKPEFQP